MGDCSSCPSYEGKVKLGKWQYPRRFLARACGVAVEIALESCPDGPSCPTCRSRVDSCASILDSKGVEYQKIPVNNGVFFFLPGVVEAPSPEVVSFFLAEKFDLTVVPA